MRLHSLLIAAIVLFAVNSCVSNSLIKDRLLKKQVETGFRQTIAYASERKEQLFGVFREKLTPAEREGLMYLFAFMPLSDLADYSGRFFLDNVSLAIKAREEAPWGKSIPEDIFLRYLLPLRVNNENLDSFRIVYYNEIKNRIRGLDAEKAALEINHWCHEKVTYQPSDIRTSGPIAAILSARGRCGEETTFTVSALRTAGLPARQVYVPKWSHTDDNHAWVEVYIDGEWKYMGACEPEPFLNMGWFTKAAGRAMLIHAKPFGHASSENNVISVNSNHSVLNILSSYAPVRKIVAYTPLKQTERQNLSLELRVFNFAEFSPVATFKPDRAGVIEFETGHGDLLIWLTDGIGHDFRLVKQNDNDTILFRTLHEPRQTGEINMDIEVPAGSAIVRSVPESVTESHSRRLAAGDSLRKAYTASWMSDSEAGDLARSVGADPEIVRDILTKSMGNYREIKKLLRGFPEVNPEDKLLMLGLVSEKDLRDTKAEIFADHLKYAVPREEGKAMNNGEIYNNYILNPRIANELLGSWRGYFADNLDENLKKRSRENPETVIAFVNSEIRLDNNRNYYGTPLSPVGVHELKRADSHSRNIYYIAVCRSAGIPARLKKETNLPQYYYQGKWTDVYFDGDEGGHPSGTLKLRNGHKDFLPQYYKHFTIGRYDKGSYVTLDFDHDTPVTAFSEGLSLRAGHYWLVTGNRTDEDNILASAGFFTVRPEETTTVDVVVRGK